MTHNELARISAMREKRQNAFEAVGELGRWPVCEPVNPIRLAEVAEACRRDAELLRGIALELAATAEVEALGGATTQ